LKRVALDDVLVMARNGLTVKQNKSAGGLPVSRIETIWNATIDKGRLGYAGLTKADTDGWLLEPGDILFSHINSLDHLGKVAIYQGDPPELVHGMNLLCLRANPEQIDPRFLLYVLRTHDFRGRLLKYVNQSVNQVSVSLTNLRRLEIPLPPLAVQKRIAAVLDKANDLRGKRRQALATLDSLLQSVFLDMFGDPVTNPKGWPTKRLVELCDPERGISYGVVQRGDHDEFGDLVLRICDIVGGQIAVDDVIRVSKSITSKYRRTVLRGGELVISIRGTVGRVAIVPEGLRGGNITRELALIPLTDHALAPFFIQLIRTHAIQHRLGLDVKGVAQSGINLADLRELLVIMPDSDAIGHFCRWAERLSKTPIGASLPAFDHLFASLQSAAFAGTLFNGERGTPSSSLPVRPTARPSTAAAV
jgi:type I restriction enzyme S subunit